MTQIVLDAHDRLSVVREFPYVSLHVCLQPTTCNFTVSLTENQIGHLEGLFYSIK